MENEKSGPQQRFHERLGLGVDLPEARRRFLQRLKSRVWDELGFDMRLAVVEGVAFEFGDPPLEKLGDIFDPDRKRTTVRESEVDERLADTVTDWYRALLGVEVLHTELDGSGRWELTEKVESLLAMSEVELGLNWRSGLFWRKGVPLLDEALVHDELEWLAGARFDVMRRPFEQGLRLYRMAGSDSEMLKSAVASVYEAVEAMAKLLTKSDGDLSALKDRVAKVLGLPRELRAVLDSYVAYGCRYRHADSAADSVRGARPHLGEAEAEFFLYLTGLLLRLGHRKLEHVLDGADEDRTGQPRTQ